MKQIIEFFVKRGVFAGVFTAAVLIVGIGAVLLIRREVFPNITFDILTINTIYPGATAEEVEKLITNPIELDLKEIDGIKRLVSLSVQNRSYISLQLDPDQITEKEGKEEVQSLVDRFQDLPEGAETPLVTSIQSKLTPIIEVSLSGIDDEFLLRDLAKRLEDEIEMIPGVARVVPKGYRALEVRVDIHPDNLSRFRLAMEDVVSALRTHNVSIPGGIIPADIKNKTSEKSVRTVGEFSTPDEVGNVVIRANDLGQTVKIKDVAKVYYSLARETIENRTNGSKSISLTILKKESGDAVTVVDNVRALAEKLQPTLHPDLKIDFVNDLSEFIRRRLSILTSNLGVGLFLVVMILSLILPFKVSLVVSLSIPFSFLIAMIYFNMNNFTINVISLMGLIIVSGMLVDNAVVVTDNAVRKVDEGMDPEEAAIEGTVEVWPSVLGSTLTTVAVFMPMLYMSGIFGKFIKQIPIGVIFPLCASLLQAFFILPAFIARVVKSKKSKELSKSKVSGFERFWENSLLPSYTNILKKTLRARYLMAVLFLSLIAGAAFVATNVIKLVLFPPEGVEQFFIRAQAPAGTSLLETSNTMVALEEGLAKLPKNELKSFVTTIGIQQQDPNDPNSKRGTHYGQIAVFLTPEEERDRSANEIIESLRESIKKPDNFTRLTFERLNNGPPVGKPIDLGVRANEYQDINDAIVDIKAELEKIPGVLDIQDSYEVGLEEYKVLINPAEAAAAGLSVATIGMSIRAAFEGIVATSIRRLDEEVEVRVTFPEEVKAKADTLEKILIPNRLQNLVQLTRIARIEKTQAIAAYEHEAFKRQVRVTAIVDENIVSSTAANNLLREKLPEINSKHPKVQVAFGGEDQDTKESMASLGRSMVIAIFAIYLILVFIFQNLLQPLLILLTVPMGFVSVVFALFTHNQPFSFMAMLGILALAGVIVNNAIVFIQFVNIQRSKGETNFNSIISAAKMRVRPIFLTTATTVVGLLPTAYGIGGLDKFVVPIALSLGWGLAIGSLLTLLVFPSMVLIVDDVTNLWNKLIGKATRA